VGPRVAVPTMRGPVEIETGELPLRETHSCREPSWVHLRPVLDDAMSLLKPLVALL
jgi:hypothetical protein